MPFIILTRTQSVSISSSATPQVLPTYRSYQNPLQRNRRNASQDQNVNAENSPFSILGTPGSNIGGRGATRMGLDIHIHAILANRAEDPLNLGQLFRADADPQTGRSQRRPTTEGINEILSNRQSSASGPNARSIIFGNSSSSRVGNSSNSSQTEENSLPATRTSRFSNFANSHDSDAIVEPDSRTQYSASSDQVSARTNSRMSHTAPIIDSVWRTSTSTQANTGHSNLASRRDFSNSQRETHSIESEQMDSFQPPWTNRRYPDIQHPLIWSEDGMFFFLMSEIHQYCNFNFSGSMAFFFSSS